MTQYGALRMWSVFLTVLGTLWVVLATAGTIIWAFEVDGFWPTLGVLLVGGPVSVFLATLPSGTIMRRCRTTPSRAFGGQTRSSGFRS